MEPVTWRAKGGRASVFDSTRRRQSVRATGTMRALRRGENAGKCAFPPFLGQAKAAV